MDRLTIRLFAALVPTLSCAVCAAPSSRWISQADGTAPTEADSGDCRNQARRQASLAFLAAPPTRHRRSPRPRPKVCPSISTALRQRMPSMRSACGARDLNWSVFHSALGDASPETLGSDCAPSPSGHQEPIQTGRVCTRTIGPDQDVAGTNPRHVGHK